MYESLTTSLKVGIYLIIGTQTKYIRDKSKFTETLRYTFDLTIFILTASYSTVKELQASIDNNTFPFVLLSIEACSSFTVL